ncbi:hypothetical protein PoB_005377500 [Plakobranchus ocellatus]|uniref:Uncharacterized protein n=1 Tax=Plakobranchus ocellatus TaxID=259542 RepID=A0AAV4C758_9GAST|nr:hypothetical protein PoB_005377500 [Plakobranchus ocellatus]
MISCFQALRQAKAPLVGHESTTKACMRAYSHRDVWNVVATPKLLRVVIRFKLDHQVTTTEFGDLDGLVAQDRPEFLTSFRPPLQIFWS